MVFVSSRLKMLRYVSLEKLMIESTGGAEPATENGTRKGQARQYALQLEGEGIHSTLWRGGAQGRCHEPVLHEDGFLPEQTRVSTVHSPQLVFMAMKRKQGQFGKLAMRYYPDKNYKRSVALFREEIRQTRGLLQALQDIGYREGMRKLSPRMVKVIEHFLGEP